MDRFDISIAPPAENDKKLYSHFTKLAAEIGKNAESRREAEKQWQPNNRKRGEMWSNGSNNSARAEGLQLEAQNNKVELELISNEIPVMKKAIEYLEALQESNQREIRIASAKIDLAREHIVKVFRKDFPSETWHVNEEVLERLVNLHPVYIGAKAKYDEIYHQSSTVELMRNANQNLMRAENRREQLAGSLKVLEKDAAELNISLKIQSDRNAAARQAESEGIQKVVAKNEEAVKEARFRILNPFKRKPVDVA